MTYAEKLRDPRWQQKRLEIFQRDEFKCVICHVPGKEIQCHHLLYLKRDPWDYPDHIFQTLCNDCHEQRQELTDKAVAAIRLAIARVPTQRLLTVTRRLCSEAMLEIEV